MPGGASVDELAAGMQKGRDLIGQHKFEEAATLLSENLEKYCSKYGEMGSECAEAYMRYGIALTRECEEAEEKQGGADVFGSSVPKAVATGAAPEEEVKKEGNDEKILEEGRDEAGVDEDDDEEEEEEGEQEGDGDGQEGEEQEEDQEEEKDDEQDEQEDQEGSSSSAAAADDKGKGPAKEKVSNVSDDPLELAWSVLDIARIIFEREDTVELMRDRETERKLKLADTYSYMGDIGLRNEKFDQCTSDYRRCLELREEVCEKDDRLLLEVHHQLAMAYSFHDTPNKPAAIQAYRDAVSVCQLRLKNLKAMLAMGDEPTDIPSSSVKPRSRGETVTYDLRASPVQGQEIHGIKEQELNDIEMILVDLQEKLESELIDSEEEAGGSSSTAGATSIGPATANPFGGDAIAAMAAQAGFWTAPAPQPAFGIVPDGAPVKPLGIFGKKAKAKAAEEGSATTSAGEKRLADTMAGVEAGDAKKARSLVSDDASAAATSAKDCEQTPAVTA